MIHTKCVSLLLLSVASSAAAATSASSAAPTAHAARRGQEASRNMGAKYGQVLSKYANFAKAGSKRA
jgi:hypothetical protein